MTLDPETLRRVVDSNVTEAAPCVPHGDGQAEKRGIIGPTDDRVLWTDRNFPYSAIGRIISGSALCSGTLIGPRHVATAAHYIAKQGERMRAPIPTRRLLFSTYCSRGCRGGPPRAGR